MIQDLHMQYTLAHMKLSRNLLAATRTTITILLQQVGGAPGPTAVRRYLADRPIALSGACATISSDALMNPFDGRDFILSSVKSVLTLLHSDQATNASPWISLSLNISMRSFPLPDRRSLRFLRLLSYHTLHDHSLYSHTIYGL